MRDARLSWQGEHDRAPHIRRKCDALKPARLAPPLSDVGAGFPGNLLRSCTACSLGARIGPVQRRSLNG